MLSDGQDAAVYTPEIADAVRRALSAAAELTGIDFAVSLLVTDEKGIAELNRNFRNVDGPTDVLSFPAYQLSGPLSGGGELPDAEWQDGLLFVGDIAISLERAGRQAKRLGHGIERETSFLALHGLLHLLGYDHMDARTEEEMTGMQRRVMERAGIGRESDGQAKAAGKAK
jgi:probable rRNA maturation factor